MSNTDWIEVSGRRGYTFFRRRENDKCKWKARNDETGEEFLITYEQALGYEPIDNAEGLGMWLGKLLLPKR